MVNGLTLLLSLLIAAGAAEWLARTIVRRVAPERFSAILARSRFEPLGQYDLIAIGDSFVETGEKQGWTTFLSERGWRVLNLGVNASGPSQYFQILDNVAPRLGRNQKVLVVLYIGNDFADESLWEQMPNETAYFGHRLEIFCSEFLWPMGCRPRTALQSPLKEWVKENSYLVRLALLLRDSVRRSSLSPSATRDRRSQIQPPLMDYSSVYVLGDNFFFIKHHNLTSYDSSPQLRSASERILRMVANVKGDTRIYFVPVLDREENGASIHGQLVRRNAPFVEQLKSVNPRVIDVNAEFSREFERTLLYRPDGHWNREGHLLFATLMNQRLKSLPPD